MGRTRPTPGATPRGTPADWPRAHLIGFTNELIVMKVLARVRLDNRGVVTVETDMTDIGTGSVTRSSCPNGGGNDGLALCIRWRSGSGDSNFPVSTGSGGQFGANNSTSGRLRRLHGTLRMTPSLRSSASTPPTSRSPTAW